MDALQYSSSDDEPEKEAKSSSRGKKSPEHRRSPERRRDHKSHRRHRSRGHRHRSRSRSPRRHYREKSPKGSKERSPVDTCRKRFDAKNKLYILAKMGIDYKVPEVDKESPGSSGLPVYYNPLTVNAGKYAEQIAKRKLLWNNKKTEEKPEKKATSSIWQGAKFSQDHDGKLTAKFQRLMGMKEGSSAAVDPKGKELIKKQEELFSSMEMQYEVARATTHTQRGVGLGFGPRHIP